MRFSLLLAFWAMTTITIAGAQDHQTTPWRTHFWAGYGFFNTHTDFTDEYSIFSPGEGAHFFGGNIAETVSGISIGLGQSYRFHPRWSLQLETRFFDGDRVYEKDRYTLSNGQRFDFPAAEGEISSWQASALIMYRFNPQHRVQVSVGTGFVAGRYWHHYRNLVRLDYTLVEGEVTILEETFTKVSKDHYGIPLQVSCEMLLTPRWSVGITTFLSNYLYDNFSLFDGDFEGGINLMAAYQW